MWKKLQQDSCEPGAYVSRSPPATHKNSLFLAMSVAMHIGPEIFLLLRTVGFLLLFGLVGSDWFILGFIVVLLLLFDWWFFVAWFGFGLFFCAGGEP